ncbi:TonB-linked outer membrane protein, SusC/RagA family [Sphingobacterium nematocida]|uniref:TonB-linked outer membrane protein, SusC/RagA family n=1 Tax=Sphingobacterium nematocida TaxID=1513896 RepID=A0A1T5GSP8_9SPHI|nr:SusC/RagA family TonB-linked outer membrane protein [Sphingobacterium nematocida]SKC11360.1 TonB-linked outer membrane protein, SusC/RagA family [Sphingobacterium nematocida]
MKKINFNQWILPLATSVVLFSSSAFSQITLKFKQKNAKEVMSSIERQSGYRFVYDESSIRFPQINIDINNGTIEQVLAQAFAKSNIEYKIVQKNILLKNTSSTTSQNNTVRSTETEALQNYSFSGRVVNENGTGLAGASIRLKNTDVVVTSNDNGDFSMESKTRTGTLQISFLGHETIEVTARAQMGNLVLSPLVSEIDEIAVSVSTGYQTIPKERATGAFGSLPKRSLEQQRLNSLSSLLEGRIAGYHNNTLRGTTSMNGVTNPLYVVDGFPVENVRSSTFGEITEALPNLNLEDIESITVLRDAAAASIYGARAANGVVVIVTKKGKKSGIEINASAVMTHTPYYFNTDRLTSSADIIDIEREWADRNSNFMNMDPDYPTNALDNMLYYSRGIQSILREKAGLITSEEKERTLNNLANAGYRYYDDVARYGKRDPFSQQYNINLSSGTEKNSFYSSATYQKNLLEDPNSKNDNLGLNLRNTTQVNKWLSVELNTYLRYGKDNQQTYNLMSPGFAYLPYDGLKNADGTDFISTAASRLDIIRLGQIQDFGLYNMDINPFEEMNRNISRTNSFSNRSFIRLNAKIAEWLNYSAAFQYEYANDNTELLYDKNSYYVRNRVNSFAKEENGAARFLMPYGNILNRLNQTQHAYNFRQQVDFEQTFNQKHHVNAIAGLEIRENKAYGADQTLYNYDVVSLQYEILDKDILSSGSMWGGNFNQNSDLGRIAQDVPRFVSMYTNAGYSYDNRFMLTGSLRWDRSNLWGTSSKYQNKPIWSLGAGWNMHNEDFMQVSWINQLKLRGSYGIGGNIDRATSPFMTAYYSNNPNVGGLVGNLASRPNPLLSWESTTTLNIGTDFTILNNRVYGSLDYYQKRGKDLLANTMGVPTEGFGYTTYKINNGEMTNDGFEATIGMDVLKDDAFRWNSNILYAYNKNKVTYVNVKAPFYVLQLDYPEAYPRIGNPYQSIYAYSWAGLNDKGIPQVYDENGEIMTRNPATLESIVYAGSKVPYHTASWTNSLSYKNFDFSIMLTYEGGHRIRNTDLPYISTRDINWTAHTNVTTMNNEIVNRWRQPGDENNTNIPRLIFPEDLELYNYDSGTLYQNADINVIDASNFQIRNISFAYRVPTSFLSNAKIKQARLQFNAENVAMFAKSKNARYMLGGYRAPNYVMGVYLTF